MSSHISFVFLSSMPHFRLSIKCFYKFFFRCLFSLFSIHRISSPPLISLSLENTILQEKKTIKKKKKNARPLSLSAFCFSPVFWNTRDLYSYKIVLCFPICLLPDFTYQRSIKESVVLWWSINMYTIHWQLLCHSKMRNLVTFHFTVAVVLPAAIDTLAQPEP